ncbi:helix-turn-helix transcriptional regulator [Nocardioides sp. CER19]|uniref:helix-turn-helix transcriptional regulator n=1 Tax=Nocardioides sp. CER19 TaxID=3038538 RepID=UPI00244A7A50|nr:helix-turn-helix transcriptional regulator [Nocardioides sp. CER19]MDH2415593.1 helix-turn-helix transcriptional regulator [Nocardioides sp. CER19]
MPVGPPVAELMEIAGTTAPLRERAEHVLGRVADWASADATWLALADPQSHAYATFGSTGLERGVLDYLNRPAVAQEIRDAELNRDRPPVSLWELPVGADQLTTWADCLIPAGFRVGMGVPLFEAGGPYVGMLTLLFAREDSPSSAVRAALAQLSPLIARGVSPLRSLAATARLVRGATSGAVLLRDGTLAPLPGLDSHALLDAGGPVVAIARDTLLAGQVYRSFVWPLHHGAEVQGHARLTVLAANDVPAFVLGTVLVTPQVDCRGLTSRELEVLGLVVDGGSNQQVARRLGIAARTVATHVEHILRKLEVQTRTLAAVQAERDGCYVPARLTVRR